jgi:DNA-binding transcriptional ArsR family regulator
MPTRIKLAKQRLVLAKLLLRMVQFVTSVYMDEQMFGSQADDALLLVAVYVGQAEHRPMTASKLAEYVGMPRPTVVRKLREMQQCGLVTIDERGAASCTIERLNSPEMVAAIQAAVHAVEKAAVDLSKMDRNPIADDDKG